jgi:hypothetical protein
MATPPHARGRGVPAALAALAALAAAVGCSGRSWVNPPVEVLDRTWVNIPPTPDTYPDPDATLVARLSATAGPPPVVPGRPLNVLVLSGGGKYGAYAAGLLCGWTAHGDRPEFDVATGISSGALTATLAFLGPKYDARMAATYYNLTPADLFRPRVVRGLLSGNALATAEPLRQLIARNLDAEAMADLRQAHCAGRRLFVATGNLTSLRPTIWDLGALATSGRPDADDLVRKVLLAACSIPAYVEPVELDVEVNGVRYRELHGDAGNVIQGFVRTANGLPAGSNLYLVTAGKVYRDPLDERPRLAGMLGATVSNSLYALYRENVFKLFALCAVTGARFHLATLPADVPVRAGSLTFDTAELRLLFNIGYQSAVNGIAWRATPPGTQPGETLTPRAGLEFVAPAP